MENDLTGVLFCWGNSRMASFCMFVFSRTLLLLSRCLLGNHAVVLDYLIIRTMQNISRIPEILSVFFSSFDCLHNIYITLIFHSQKQTKIKPPGSVAASFDITIMSILAAM